MAAGDVVADINDIPTGSPVNFQPAAGVEVLITSIATENAESRVYQTDGVIENTIVTGVFKSGEKPAIKIFLNNSVYMKMWSASGTWMISYSGIQTK